MSLIEIEIKDNGEHWHNTVKLFGLTLYRRHNYTKYKRSVLSGSIRWRRCLAILRTIYDLEEEKYR